MKLCFYTCLVLFVATATLCSGQENFITLSGIVTDAETKLPVSFASIHLSSGKTGTATNDEGEFVFKVAGSLPEDTLTISCVGYRTVKMPLSSVGKNISISLIPAVIELSAVTVNAQTGLDILKKVIARIPDNYDTSAVRLTAFYRENHWLEDFQLGLNEAVIDIYKTFRWDKVLNDQIRIIKGRKKKVDFGRDAQFLFWLSGASNGARSSLGEDIAKYHNGPWSPLNARNYRYYHYDYVGTIRDQGRDLIVLDILPKNDSRKAWFNIKLFIEEQSLAIVRADVECTEAGVNRVSRKDKGVAYAIMTKIVKATLDYHAFTSSVTYKKYNGKWYLNTITRHWEILVNSKKRNMVGHRRTTDMELMITDIDTVNVSSIGEGNIGGNEASMNALIGNDYDTAFWENYNILKPVLPDSLKAQTIEVTEPEEEPVAKRLIPNRQNGFTRADTLRGKLTPLRTCYDVTFYHLDVKVDMNKRSVAGNNLIRFKVEEPFKRMQVDLYANMKIGKIVFKGETLDFTREYNAVFIDFPEMLKAGGEQEIRIYYEGIPKIPDFGIHMDGGVLWDQDSLGNPWVQMVCQGSGASLWWPNKDHQSDEPDSMKIWITVPAEFTEISNGRLMRKTAMPENTTRYEWLVSYPINNYNVTFNIGKYAHYRDYHITDDTLTIDYYVMAYNLDRAKRMFMQVKPMLKAFEHNFGKYPFPRDGFTLVESLYPMEHQSGVCIGKITQQNSGDSNPLLWHEAAHEWWGNAVTTRDIADMWIHEAFATYAEALVIEHRFSKDEASRFVFDQVDAVSNKEPVIGVYDVNHIHYDIGDMYSKGSLLLHTFRNVLDNDSLWVALLRGIQEEYRYKTVSSDELVRYISAFTGTDYTYLFDQYLKHTSLPQLQLKVEEKGNDLEVRYRWKADVENFRMPVKASMGAGRLRVIYPVTEWKTMILKDVAASDFYVDDEQLYIGIAEMYE